MFMSRVVRIHCDDFIKYQRPEAAPLYEWKAYTVRTDIADRRCSRLEKRLDIFLGGRCVILTMQAFFYSYKIKNPVGKGT